MATSLVGPNGESLEPEATQIVNIPDDVWKGSDAEINGGIQAALLKAGKKALVCPTSIEILRTHKHKLTLDTLVMWRDYMYVDIVAAEMSPFGVDTHIELRNAMITELFVKKVTWGL